MRREKAESCDNEDKGVARRTGWDKSQNLKETQYMPLLESNADTGRVGGGSISMRVASKVIS